MARPRARWLTTLGLTGSAAALALAAAVPLIADVSVEPAASAIRSGSIGEPLPLDAAAPPDLRALPLGLTDEQRDRLVLADDPTDLSALRDEIRDGAARFGLGDVIDEAISVEVTLDPSHAYPYVLTGIDELIRPNLDLAAVEADPNAALEFSGLLIMLAVMRDSSGGTPDLGMPAAVAFSFLDAARAVAPTCDLQINLAYLVTLGRAPALEDVDTELSRANDLCENDPTPAWIHGLYLRGALHESGFDIPTPKPRSEMRVDARKLYAAMRENFPNSPLGWVGDADLLMDWATKSAESGAEPFQVRSWEREALDLYRRARTKSADPRIASGEARILAALGEHPEALEQAEMAIKAAPKDLSARIVLADSLADAGRHVDAGRAYADENRSQVVWSYVAPTNLHRWGFTGAFGWSETPDVQVYDVTYGGYGGASVKDTGFIPTSRHVPDPAFCPAAQQRAQLALAGRTDELNQEIVAAPWSAECTANSYYQSLADRYRAIAALSETADSRSDALSRLPAAEYLSLDEVELDAWDAWQDLLRSGGELKRAERVAKQWTKAQPDTGLAHQRLGEIHLLLDDPKSAISPLKRAVTLLTALADTGEQATDPESLTYPNMRDLAKLQLGYAQVETGNESAGRKAYQDVVDAYAGEEHFWDDKLVMYAHSQIGELDFGKKRWKQAAQSFDEAIALGVRYESKALYGLDQEFEISQSGMLRGAQENNLALAEAKQGRTKEAVVAARAALTRDALNPVYLDTLAFVQHLGGDDSAAAKSYKRAIGADTSSYVSSNNLAVVLAGAGKIESAKKLLRTSVAANPNYAPAWHNLGVLDGRSWKPSALLASQGALAKAAHLDPDQRDAGLGLQVDDEVYNSGLDVSQTLTADWSYATSATSTVRPITLTMIVLLLLRAARIVGLERVGSFVAERVVSSGPVRSKSMGWFWRRLRVRWGLIGSAIALAWGALFVRPQAATLVYILAVAALVTLPFLARMVIAARRNEPVRHFTWTPAVAIAAVGTPFGLGFTPFPGIDESTQAPSRAVRWISPAIVCITAVVFLALTLATSAPLARDISAAALLMSASMLTPVPPMDGANLTSRVANIAITGALAVTTLAYGLHWV